MATLRSNWFYLLVLAGLLTLPLYAESDIVDAVMPRGLTGSALLHVCILIFFFECGPDFRLRLPLRAVQGLINLGRFGGSFHSAASPQVILSIGPGIEELG